MAPSADYYPVPPQEVDRWGGGKPERGMAPPGPLAHDAAGSVRMVCPSCGREHRRSARPWADGKGHDEWCVWCPGQRLAFIRPSEGERLEP
jgi:hypothetical protein